MKERTYENYYEDYIERKLSTRCMGELYGVDRKTVEYWLKKYKITRPKMYLNKYSEEYLVNLIQNEGYLIQDVAVLTGGTGHGLGQFLARKGYNFQNHANQTKKQSELMSTEANPTKGTQRPQYIKDAIIYHRRMNAKERWLDIPDFKAYAKTARYIAYAELGATLTEGCEIDHVFSVKDCWESDVPVDLCSHTTNLRIIPIADNKTKAHNSDVTYEQFWENIINSTTIESTSKDGSE